MIQQLIPAFLISSGIASLAYWRQSLSRSGVIGALLVGTLTFGLGGWFWGVLLGIFLLAPACFHILKKGKSAKRRKI